MISLVTTCRPFIGHYKVIQLNALRSWRKFIPNVEIVIGGDEEGVREIASEIGAVVILNVKRSEYGVPLLSSMLGILEYEAQGDIRVYINADIILLTDWYTAVMNLDKLENFYAVGRRWDTDIYDELNFDNEDILKTLVNRRGVIHGQFGMDFMIGRPDLWKIEIPPFIIGRPCYDGWMLNSAFLRNIPVIDLTFATKVIHQNHDYKHFMGGIENDPQVRNNRSIYYCPVGTDSADYYMKDGEIIKR
jgi:hypothetical protein